MASWKKTGVTVGVLAAALFAGCKLYYHALVIARLNAEELYDARALGICQDAIPDYVYDHHAYPPADHWEEAIRPYCDPRAAFSVMLYSDPGQPQHRFAMNRNLSGVPISSLKNPDRVVVLYETISNRKDANGIPCRMPGLHPDYDEYQQVFVCGDGWDDEEYGCSGAVATPPCGQ